MTRLTSNDYFVIRDRLVSEMLDCKASNIFSNALKKEGINDILDIVCLSYNDIEDLFFTEDNNIELEYYCKRQILTFLTWLYQKQVSSLECKTLEFWNALSVDDFNTFRATEDPNYVAITLPSINLCSIKPKHMLDCANDVKPTMAILEGSKSAKMFKLTQVQALHKLV